MEKLSQQYAPIVTVNNLPSSAKKDQMASSVEDFIKVVPRYHGPNYKGSSVITQECAVQIFTILWIKSMNWSFNLFRKLEKNMKNFIFGLEPMATVLK